MHLLHKIFVGISISNFVTLVEKISYKVQPLINVAAKR